MFLAAGYLEDLRAGTVCPDAPGWDGLLVHPRLALVSATGCGKTAFLRHMAWLWTCAVLDVRQDTLLLPVYLPLRELSGPLPELLARRNRERGWGLPDSFFAERIAAGACFLLLDGLGEAPDSGPYFLPAADANRTVLAARPDCRVPAGFHVARV